MTLKLLVFINILKKGIHPSNHDKYFQSLKNINKNFKNKKNRNAEGTTFTFLYNALTY